ncbi:hypothetical protein BHE96_10290 [Bacillus subtilis]|nr:hypothetical protein BHE96_10290 [Bacillus subtilis]
MKKTAIALLVSTIGLTGAAASANAAAKSEPASLPHSNLEALTNTDSFHVLKTGTDRKNGVGKVNLARTGPDSWKTVVSSFTPNNVTKLSLMGFQESGATGSASADVTYELVKSDGTVVSTVRPSGGNYSREQFYKVFSVNTSSITGKQLYIRAHNNDTSAQVTVNVDVYWDYNY